MGYVRPKRAKRPANRPKWPLQSLRRPVWAIRFFEIHDPGAFDEHFFNGLLKALARWKHTCPTLSIAVNVSTFDISDSQFALHVQKIALKHQAPLSKLRFEITESSLMEDADRVLPVLGALRDMGIQLSIDDFGTGYSSLAYLSRLPVSELKIDRSFVSDSNLKSSAKALLRTIIDLGHSLGMTVTAEGVETKEEYALLAELGCDQAQGYLIAKPMEPEAAEEYVRGIPDLPRQKIV